MAAEPRATEVVSRILGHKHPGTTQAIYQHAVPALEEEAIARFPPCSRGPKPRRARYQTGIRAAKTKEVPIARHPTSPTVSLVRGLDLNQRPLGHEKAGHLRHTCSQVV